MDNVESTFFLAFVIARFAENNDKPNALKQRKMTKDVKNHGRVYTPHFLVCIILDYGGYNSPEILQKHVIDNSCGNGAFLIEIVNRYCKEYFKTNNNLQFLNYQLETFIHGIELDAKEYASCISNLNKTVESFGLANVRWDIMNADTLTVDKFNGRMDFVFGNPPYVRVHNLEESYDSVKKYRFAEQGMTDLFIVFFEIGFNMLADNGTMCLITPSSWLCSKAGKNLRDFIKQSNILSGVIDLGHFQPFEATTYTLISRFQKSNIFTEIDYNIFDDGNMKERFVATVSMQEMCIADNFYLSDKDSLLELQKIKTAKSSRYVAVKNGFATLADKIFIGDFDFDEGTISILKASTRKWSKCIYPYDSKGKPLTLNDFSRYGSAYNYLLENKDKLSKSRDIEDDTYWYLFGRTQALKDVSKMKYAINTIIKDINSLKLEIVSEGKGLYSGLYILTQIDFEIIQQLLYSEDFIKYVKMLKNYKSGGYYTFASKDLEQYLNYKLTEKYGQSRISNSCWELF